MTVDVDAITARARDLWSWADGYEDTNEAHARRCRLVARDVLDLIEAYDAELSGRVAMQANYERALAVISSRAYERMLAMPVVRHDNGESPADDPESGFDQGYTAITSNGHNPLL